MYDVLLIYQEHIDKFRGVSIITLFKFELSLQKEGKRMFTNVGGKIQKLALFVCTFGIIVSIGFGAIAFLDFSGFLGALIGILIIVVGSLFAWLGSVGIYAFGEMVENINFIADLMAEAADEKYSQE